MLSPQHTRRAQRIVIFIGLGLAAYYFLIFHPLAQRAVQADQPLRAAWDKLSAARIRGGGQHLDLIEMDRQIRQAKTAVTALDRSQERIRASVASDATVRLKNHEQFQLVDFQIEKLLRIEELGRAANQNTVTIAPSVFANFPEYRADRGLPELLWGQLIFVDQLLSTAIRCKVSAVQSLDLPSYTAHVRSTNEPAFLYEIPMKVEFVGSMESISKLLASLPLRAQETTAANLPQAPADKPALFVHRFILTKNSTENPDEARLDLRACGFVYRE